VLLWDHYYERQAGGFRGAAYENLRRMIRHLIDEDPVLSQYTWDFPRSDSEFRLVTPSLTDALPRNWVPTRTPDEALEEGIVAAIHARNLKKRSVWDILTDEDD
jgi:hypothetical protein